MLPSSLFRPSPSSRIAVSTSLRLLSSSSSSPSPPSIPLLSHLSRSQQQKRRLASSGALDKSSLSDKIRPQLSDPRRRLFAVVHINDRQWKVTSGDLIVLEGVCPLSVGDRINLDKVLIVGSADFTIVGRPTFEKGDVRVEATVVERSHKYPELYYRHFNHYQTVITRWRTREMTTVRIDSIRASPDMLSEHSSEETREAVVAMT